MVVSYGVDGFGLYGDGLRYGGDGEGEGDGLRFGGDGEGEGDGDGFGTVTR